MIDWRMSVSAPPQECQIVTELPAGGGDSGGRGGNSVGVGPGVPTPLVGGEDGIGNPLRVAVDVTKIEGVRVALEVDVAGPAEGAGVFVLSGPG